MKLWGGNGDLYTHVLGEQEKKLEERFFLVLQSSDRD